MEVDSTIDTPSVVRIAVLGVGRMPAALTRDYVEMVIQHDQIDLKSLRSFYTEHQKNPFTQLNWETGLLRFKFMVGGAMRSPWEDFQVHRKIHGVIGVCHFPVFHDVEAIQEQFSAICKAYPSARVNKCVAFQASHEVASLERPGLVLLGPESHEAVKCRLQVLMQEFAASILMDFEKQVLLADHLGGTLITPLDSQASLTADEIAKTKKKWLGRVQKTIGDYCLLVGSPADANAHYATAVELSKLTGDILWQAGAAEGGISALLVSHGAHFLDDDVKARYLDVIQLYKRAGALIFELEADLKLARCLCRKQIAKDVVDLLTNAVESGKSLTEANDRLVLYIEVSRVFEALGYHRKAAFFSRKVACAYLQQGDQRAASGSLQVLRLISKVYCPQKFNGETLDVVFKGQWDNLQIDVLGDMLSAAVRSGDAISAWKTAAQLLRIHYPLITPATQTSLAKAMQASSARLPGVTRCLEIALPFVRLHSLPDLEINIIERKLGNEEWWKKSVSSGPFIYTPLAGRRGSSRGMDKLTWIVGEAVQVMVEAANPCAFQVQVDSICLSVGLVEFEASPFSFTLPPNSCHIFPLTGVPLSSGPAKLRGCFVTFSGVVTEHSFEDGGQAVRKDITDPFRSCGVSTSRVRMPSITVVPRLAHLNCFIVGGQGAVVLYEGEIQSIQLGLSNIGTMPVSEAIISVVGKLKDQVMMVNIGDHLVQAALPLNPGDTVYVPVELKLGAMEPTPKQGTPLHFVIHYAGNNETGRRMTVPLQLHVSRGLRLIQARLLSMEVPVQISRCSTAVDDAPSDPYRGSRNLQVLELELWNATDVLFEVTVSVTGDGVDHSKVAGHFRATTRIDKDHSARVLVPLEKLHLTTIASIMAKPGPKQQGNDKQQLNATVDEISTRVCVNWSAGRNNTGTLHLKGAIREALRESVLEVLLPDPLTFAFRFARDVTSCLLMAHDLSQIEMLVRNNTGERIQVTLSIACRDVTGANCLEDTETLLWAGALDGVEVEVPPRGEIVHSFLLCFLVPGDYTLFGAAVISGDVQQFCHSGPPFIVKVV